jgi:hypothetical protein
MTINTDAIIEIGKIIGAVGVIAGVIFAFVKWLLKQDKQSCDIKLLHEQHEKDLRDVQEELCIVNYAVFAALDALKQQGYNGGVTDARDKLEKHINNKAHKK